MALNGELDVFGLVFLGFLCLVAVVLVISGWFR